MINPAPGKYPTIKMALEASLDNNGKIYSAERGFTVIPQGAEVIQNFTKLDVDKIARSINELAKPIMTPDAFNNTYNTLQTTKQFHEKVSASVYRLTGHGLAGFIKALFYRIFTPKGLKLLEATERNLEGCLHTYANAHIRKEYRKVLEITHEDTETLCTDLEKLADLYAFADSGARQAINETTSRLQEKTLNLINQTLPQLGHFLQRGALVQFIDAFVKDVHKANDLLQHIGSTNMIIDSSPIRYNIISVITNESNVVHNKESLDTFYSNQEPLLNLVATNKNIFGDETYKKIYEALLISMNTAIKRQVSSFISSLNRKSNLTEVQDLENQIAFVKEKISYYIPYPNKTETQKIIQPLEEQAKKVAERRKELMETA